MSGGTRGTKAMRGDGVVGGCFVSGRTVLCVWTIDCPQHLRVDNRLSTTKSSEGKKEIIHGVFTLMF